MQYKAVDAADYISQLPEERQAAMKKLRAVIKKNLPKGFNEGVGYGMMGWSVPHSLYPAGYHCKPEDPLPFMGIASQKNFIAVYHMGIYAIPSLHKWFVTAHAKASGKNWTWVKVACARRLKRMRLFYLQNGLGPGSILFLQTHIASNYGKP